MKLKTALMGAVAGMILAPMAYADGHVGERGRDGNVNIIYWQAVSTMNPYLSGGTKEIEAASLVIEPLARYDAGGTLVPFLATEVPTIANGGVSEDLTTITWQLKPDLLWSDGTAVTAADVIFTWQYCTAEGGGCAQAAKFEGVESVEALDDLTIKITFEGPKPYPYNAFVGGQSPIIQAAQFADCLGPKAPECTDANFNPIGTGPFTVTNFLTNDVISLAANENYREPGKPAFATVNFKGGGDAASAGRSVLETGEFDYAWNLQLAPDVISAMMAGGQGEVLSAFGTNIERLEMNLTDPSPSLPEGERATVMHPHPFLTDGRVRKALSIAIDRQILVDVGYGPAGQPNCNLVPAPALYASDNTECLTQNIPGAIALLEEAGFMPGPDGIRVNADGVRLSVLFQTSTNAVRQDVQALIKADWEQIGVETELRNIDAGVFFGGDPGSPDTFQRFYADVEMYTNNFEGNDPQAYLAAYKCGNEPRPESQWQGENINRVCDAGYDAMIAEYAATSDPAARAALAIKMNDFLTKDNNIIVPLIYRGRVSARSNTLGGVELNSWDSELWNIADWYRISN
ncbi:MAG: peptide ABC transporter substrate-binding protein [Yoonia sp.]|uniref:peptide ABC transporter substrate-binding protein n=1 Tax=Yoonia sp. TaxID=2212373 RepID=UPI00273D8EF8|nr:peptide ABC transporter substrate-binding protein [Yoonia sp.]MDP5084012.1 peptide ABC transporter substrate-binding protein [Yoonia sp.]